MNVQFRVRCPARFLSYLFLTIHSFFSAFRHKKPPLFRRHTLLKHAPRKGIIYPWRVPEGVHSIFASGGLNPLATAIIQKTRPPMQGRRALFFWGKTLKTRMALRLMAVFFFDTEHPGGVVVPPGRSRSRSQRGAALCTPRTRREARASLPVRQTGSAGQCEGRSVCIKDASRRLRRWPTAILTRALCRWAKVRITRCALYTPRASVWCVRPAGKNRGRSPCQTTVSLAFRLSRHLPGSP